MFGSLPEPDLTVVQLPDGTLRDFAAPGVMMLSHRIWDPNIVIARWPPGGLAMVGESGAARIHRRCVDQRRPGSLFGRALCGASHWKRSGTGAIDEFAVGSLMYDNSAPVAQSARLVPYSSEYRSVVMNKGAMLFHMLRAQMGDLAFKSLLHAFYAKYQGKTATVPDFEQMAIGIANAGAKAARRRTSPDFLPSG